MAYQRPKLASELQDDTFYVSFVFPAAADMVDGMAVFWCEKDTILEAANLRYTTSDVIAQYPSSSSESAHITGTLTLKYAASGTAITSGTALTTAYTLSGTANTNLTLTLSTTNNIIPAGSCIGIDINLLDVIAGACLTLRLTTRRH